MADSEGRIANLEGTPEQLAIETPRGLLARADFGSRQVTKTPVDQPVRYHAKCLRMYDLLKQHDGKLDTERLKSFFADHAGEGNNRICVHNDSYDPMSLDSILWNCSTREAWIKRGPGCTGRWQRFTLEEDSVLRRSTPG
jgi:hypothetical protein